MNAHLNTSPSNTELALLENWLLDEYELENEGFYCNWNLIVDSYHQNQLATFCIKGEPIGFITWHDGEIHRNVNIMSIHPNYRRKGLGRNLFTEFEKLTRQKGFVAIKLFCSPRDSEHFWRKMSFIQFPNCGYSEPSLTLFKTLIEVTPSILGNPMNKLELWDLEPYQIRNSRPRWTWDLLELSISKPILQACNNNWNLKWTSNGKVLEEGKVKYFQRNRSKINYPPFLYIKELKV